MWFNVTFLQAQYCVKMTGVFEGKMGTKRSHKSSITRADEKTNKKTMIIGERI